MRTHLPILAALAATISLAACASEEPVGEAAQPLQAVCIDDASLAPMNAWLCPEEHVVECVSPHGTPAAFIYVTPVDRSCDDIASLAVDSGPFLRGTSGVTVSADETDLCHASIRVEDTLPPIAKTHTLTLWPPNHKMHTIGIDDCVTVVDACDDHVEVFFTHVTSDEPDDAEGDGNTEPDVEVFSCDAVDVRAERQGTGNGRVYHLGWRAIDHAGNSAEGTCTVEVPHDQGKDIPIDDGAATHLSVDLCNSGPV